MKIYSVIVCFKPEITALIKICNILLNDTNIILVDNTEVCTIHELSGINGIDLIVLNENTGIAKAQNIGIQIAVKKGAEVIVFFDQDSEIENDFIYKLTAPLKNNVLMVVSPVFIDKKNGFRFPSMRLNKFGLLKKIRFNDLTEPYDVDVVISSGSATTKKTFEIVGLMNEDYFIDFVDTEWSLRCRSMGIPIKVIPTAIMKHAIGDKSIDLFFIRIFIHSPLRTYYKIRNSFLFARCIYVPFLLSLKEIVSALIHNLLIIIFFSKNKKSYLKIYFQAIYHGLLGNKGKKYIKN